MNMIKVKLTKHNGGTMTRTFSDIHKVNAAANLLWVKKVEIVSE